MPPDALKCENGASACNFFAQCRLQVRFVFQRSTPRRRFRVDLTVPLFPMFNASNIRFYGYRQGIIALNESSSPMDAMDMQSHSNFKSLLVFPWSVSATTALDVEVLHTTARPKHLIQVS